MRKKVPPSEKPLYWVASSRKDLMAMPDAVVKHIGAVLSVAQYGGKHPDAKAWKGLGPGVFEVVSDLHTNTYRAAYVVRFERAIYVLHCFQKKSPTGIRTAKVDVDLIATRLRSAARDHEERYGAKEKKR
jgi:phage-related protein